MGTSLLGVIIAIRVVGSINARGQGRTESPALSLAPGGACAPRGFNGARIAVAGWFVRLRVAIAVMRMGGPAARAPRSAWARALSEVSLVTTKTAR